MADAAPLARVLADFARTVVRLLRFVAASDESIARVEALQVSLQEGACKSAYDSGELVVCRDLRADTRWPRYAPGAVAAGVIGVLGCPMEVDGRTIGALNVYRTSPLELSDEDLETTRVLTAVGASFVINAQERGESREVVERTLSLGTARGGALRVPSEP